MSKYSVFTTPGGTELPMMLLKGKPYMQVAHRLIWFTEVAASYETTTEFLVIDDSQTVARVTIKLYDKDGKFLKQASATKRETKTDFSDHTEKAETGAMGRALAILGFGTQFAVADLDEGSRLADSPVAIVEKDVKPAQVVAAATKPTSSFKRPTKPVSEDL